MFIRKSSTFFLSLVAILVISTSNFAQKQGDGTVPQRLEIMRQKLDTMRRSLESSVKSLKDDSKDDKSKKDDKDKDKIDLDSPYARLTSLQKEVTSLQSEVNNLRGKVDRAEKYESSDVDSTETAVNDLSTRVDNALVETAAKRAVKDDGVGKPRDIKKQTKKFLGLIPYGKTRDEFEELLGAVAPDRDRELFIVATREVRKGNHEIGRLLFQTIITTYPDSPYLPMSKLAVADSFYLEGDTSNLIQAAAGYQDWLTFFPTHPLADKVLLKVAECEMRQIGLPDRDITRAKRAEQRLKAFYQQYPNSPIASEAAVRLKEVQNNLGLHNLDIANQYYTQSVKQQKGGLKGAQSRYREILDKYPNFGFMDEVLFKMAVTYQVEEEMEEAAKYYKLIISDYPYSEHVEKSKEQLELMGETIPPVNPEKKDILPPEKKSMITNFRHQFFGIYPMTIDKNGVLMTKNFDKTKFELIDQIIENQGEITTNQIPQSLTTIVRELPKEQKGEKKDNN